MRTPINPDGVPLVSPWLAVSDVAAAIDFYRRAFGFELRSTQTGTDGKPFHAVLAHEGALFQVGPEGGDFISPKKRGGATMYQYVYVERVDVLYERALDEGAMPVRAPRSEFWGDRCCLVKDPDGHAWMFATMIPGHDAWKETRARITDEKKLSE